MKDKIIKSLAAWLDTEASILLKEIPHLSDDEKQILETSLRFSHTKKERFARRLFTGLLNSLPSQLYRFHTNVLKRLRRDTRVNRRIHFTPCLYMELATTLAVRHKNKLSSATLCLTHDIDTQECASFWPRVVRIEEEFGVSSTYNVLTSGPYRLDLGWLDELETKGFEIGLHGDTHDMAIGFRDMQLVRDRLRRCQDVLKRPQIGFRAPAMAISEPLLKILKELGFRYDSSIKANVYYTGGVDVCIPYLYPSIGIWEFPLVLQDDGLFRDQTLNEKEALQIVQDVIDVLRPYNGLIVFNSHPSLLQSRTSFYRHLLNWLLEEDVNIVLAGDLVKRLDAFITQD